MTAHDWLCGGIAFALYLGTLVALIWAEGRRG